METNYANVIHELFSTVEDEKEIGERRRVDNNNNNTSNDDDDDQGGRGRRSCWSMHLRKNFLPRSCSQEDRLLFNICARVGREKSGVGKWEIKNQRKTYTDQ